MKNRSKLTAMQRSVWRRFNLFNLPRNVIALGLVSLFNDASSEIIYPLLPLFLSTTLGASAAFIGVLEGVAESTASLLKLPAGWLSDRMQRRRVWVVWGYSLASLIRPLLALTTAAWQVLALRFIDRIGKGLRSAPRDALIADSIAASQRGLAFGFHRALDHAGALLGSLAASGLMLLLANNYRAVFWAATVPALIAILILLFFVTEPAPKLSHSPTPALPHSPFSTGFKQYLAILLLFTLGNSSDAFLLLRAQQCGVAAALIPLLWAALHLSKTISSIVGGQLSDRFGRRRLIVAGWLIYALIYAGFAVAGQAGFVWLLFVLYGIYFGLTEGVEKALVADLVDAQQRGTAYGWYNLVIGLGALPASLLAGLLWDYFGAPVALLTGAGLSLLAAWCLSLSGLKSY